MCESLGFVDMDTEITLLRMNELYTCPTAAMSLAMLERPYLCDGHDQLSVLLEGKYLVSMPFQMTKTSNIMESAFLDLNIAWLLNIAFPGV